MKIALIGGSGSGQLVPGKESSEPLAATPWGPLAASLSTWREAGHVIYYLPRHGATAGIAPHLVNYRANIWALRQLGVDHVIGINAVGGIDSAATPGRLVIPDQLIDYTWGRAHTFAGEAGRPLQHVDFTMPFSAPLRAALIGAAAGERDHCLLTGCYGVTQGPRLETAAEIDRLERDGCTVVGMTAMPEAGLAREAGLSYAIVCLVVNQAAGRVPDGQSIHGQIDRAIATGMARVRALLATFLASL